MLPYPSIDPVALKLGSIEIHWYGIMYLIAFILGALIFKKLAKEKKLNLSSDLLSDIVLGGVLGVILGGRLGYILFYNLPFYLSSPLNIFKIWEGGMSFHGGLIGVIIALFAVSKKRKMPFYRITDLVVVAAPLGLFFGRIGNFINGELYGRITDSPLCMVFPSDPENCRYPSQLFHALGEGLILFLIMYTLRKKFRKEGILSWTFALLYGVFRFIEEMFREPDPQIGYYFGLLTQGQIFSIIMIAIAGALLIHLNKQKITPST